MDNQTISTEEDRYLTYKETCSYLSISMSTLRRWIADGHFPLITRMNGLPRIKFSDLQNWLAGLEEK